MMHGGLRREARGQCSGRRLQSGRVTVLIAHALVALPRSPAAHLPFFCQDDFWSETDEPGNHWQSLEADPELQNLVSALTAGPVGPADAIGRMNRTRLMQVGGTPAALQHTHDFLRRACCWWETL